MGYPRAKIEKTNIADGELFSRIARLQVDALAALYDRHSAALYGLACKILKNETLAEDVLQELFVAIWQNSHKFDGKRGASIAWLMVMCRNRCIDKLRANATKRKYSEAIEESQFHQIPDDVAKDPFEFAQHNDTQRIVQKALAQLPPEQREPIVLAYFEGLSQTEIAAGLNIPLGTIKTRMRLGMRKLRNLLKNSGNLI